MRAALAAGLSLGLLGGCQPAKAGAGAPSPLRVTVQDVLTQPGLVGKTVVVSGTCLGYSVPTIAVGSPPVTRSDWQLEDAGDAVWVTGPLPEGCTATGGATGRTRITAAVAQDTLPGLGGEKPRLRQFLVVRGR
ncbi:MAG TPA: hypothetical protein VNJ71_01745 [Gemmatimonadales bacterium]|nr:hypothetical protein [Gemmatimonadales bacterium]